MNTYTLDLGGQDRVLQFGKPGFLKHIQEITKQDPFEWFNSLVPKEGEEKKPVIQNIDDAAVIIYAGLNTNLDMKDLDNIPFEKVTKWANGVDFDKMAEIVQMAFGSFQAEKNGEPTDEKKKELVG